MRRLLHSVIGATMAIGLSVSANAESVLKVSVHADLKNIDPIWTTALITANHGYTIYDTLFGVDANFKLQPQMAESYTVSDDGLIYVIKLRDGLKWHDGASVTAADCVASIARWGKRDGLGQRLMKRMDKMEAVDARTIKLTLKEPFGATILALGKDMSNVPFMMPERVAKTDAHKQISELIGSGPYKIEKDKWVPGSKVIYTKNTAYVPRNEPASNFSGGKVVNFDRLEWHYIPDASTALNALQAGEIDLIENLKADLVPIAKAAEGITVETTDALGWQPWLVINHKHPPFDNIKARQALQWMVDQATYQQANSSIPNSWRTCPSFFICDTPYGSEVGAERVMQQNFETAKKLLKEAGYKGEKVVLLHPTDIPQLHSASLVTANLLRKIGINLDDQAMDWSTVTSRRAEKKKPSEGGWNIFHTAWPAKMLMNPMLHYGVAGTCDKAWFGWPCDDKLQELGKKFANEGDPKKLVELSIQMQARAMEYVTYIPLGQYFFFRAYRSDLSGIIPSVASFFWNIKRN